MILAVPTRPPAVQARVPSWLGPLLALVWVAPLYLSLPVHEDTAYYSIQARHTLRGGVPYRDLFEPNFPGALWVHMLAHRTVGDSWVAIRCVDLMACLVTLYGLSRLCRSGSAHSGRATWLFVGLLLYYATRWHGCHCQRDLWALCPAILAVIVRYRRVLSEADSRASTLSHGMAWTCLEGIGWSLAIWLKPHMIVPLAATLFASWALVRDRRWMAKDTAGLLITGSILATAGLVWLYGVGAFEAFWSTMVEWNPEYVRAGKRALSVNRWVYLATRLAPLSLFHVLAIPLAIRAVISIWRWGRRPQPLTLTTTAAQGLLAACYLGWGLQVVLLQHSHDYVHLPFAILAFAVVATCTATSTWQAWLHRSALAITLAGSLITLVQMSTRWWDCVQFENLPTVRNDLARIKPPNWQDYDRTAKFLSSLSLRDGDLHCFHHLYFYDDLRIEPSFRYVYMPFLLSCFPSRRDEILGEFRQSTHRYVVSDLAAEGLSESVLEPTHSGNGWRFNASFPDALRGRYPWRHPIVHRSGTILVQEVARAPATSPRGDR